MNEDLDGVATWSTRNALVLNPSKSKFMVLGTKRQIDRIVAADPRVAVMGNTVNRVDEAKNLGVMLDSRLRFESHVQNLFKICFYRLKVLYKVRSFLSEKARITLVESLILSKLNYADLVYGPRLSVGSQQRIQRIQNACCRFCFNIPPRSHVTPYLNSASMLNMESRRRLHLATMMFDLVKFKNPEYLYAKLKFSVSQRVIMVNIFITKTYFLILKFGHQYNLISEC
ncbi:hypothetical protein ABMA28_007377 [Loxostege sticticalis]|uniref:Uncharacterized protein n=1 Tax=Loxostege sticticalis TaxID=481309 RepID=A0ABD0TQH3_LOXSC